MEKTKFDFVFLGQSVLKYEVPLIVFDEIVQTYRSKVSELPPANKQLVGKIKNEHSLFFDGAPNNLMQPHNFLSLETLSWFKKTFSHYLHWNKVRILLVNFLKLIIHHQWKLETFMCFHMT